MLFDESLPQEHDANESRNSLLLALLTEDTMIPVVKVTTDSSQSRPILTPSPEVRELVNLHAISSISNTISKILPNASYLYVEAYTTAQTEQQG